MSYGDGEALILAAVRNHADYSNKNTSQADWGLLNSGNDAHYLVLRPGPFVIETVSLGGVGASTTATERSVWTTQVMLYQRYVNDGTTATNLYDHMENVISEIQRWRYAADTTSSVVKVRAIGSEELPEEVIHVANGPLWLRWTLNVQWTEERTITYAE